MPLSAFGVLDAAAEDVYLCSLKDRVQPCLPHDDEPERLLLLRAPRSVKSVFYSRPRARDAAAAASTFFLSLLGKRVHH